MNEKEKLLQLAYDKIADNSEFMAFYLKKYGEFEKISEQEICSNLNCSVEDYYKLALCKAPYVNANDFVARLNNISQYTGISVFGLNNIVKRVHSIMTLSENESSAYLMAARDKNKKKGQNNDNDINADS